MIVMAGLVPAIHEHEARRVEFSQPSFLQ